MRSRIIGSFVASVVIVGVSVFAVAQDAAPPAAPAAPAAQAPAAAVAGDVSGTWKYNVDFGGNEVENIIVLKQEGEKLTGTVTGFDGMPIEIMDGSVKDGMISFKTNSSFGELAVVNRYSGKVENDVFKGKQETIFERNFEAKK